MPSIRYLAKQLRVSVITTKRAYDDLEAEGFLETTPGKGTYVSLAGRDRLREVAFFVWRAAGLNMRAYPFPLKAEPIPRSIPCNSRVASFILALLQERKILTI